MAPMGRPCTTFLAPSTAGPVVAKSYDWDNGRGMLIANKRGVAKKALTLKPWDQAATWTSRYASLTFNQYGRELPNGGMNTAGLVVEIMWLNESRYPGRDGRPSLNELQWIQYQLDRFATVAEVVKAAPELRVSRVHAAVHYLVCDKGGACAAFEYLDGQLVITDGASLVAPALTNHTYTSSAAHLARHQGFGGTRAVPGGRRSLARFVRAATMTRSQPVARSEAVEAAFRGLDDVAQGSYTKWQIVYEPADLRVHFRTRDARRVKYVDLGDLDDSCSSIVGTLDLAFAEGGDMTHRLVPYHPLANRQLIQASVGDLGAVIGPLLVRLAASYPESLACAAP